MDCFVFSFLDSNIFRSSTSSFDATIYSTLTFRCIATHQAAIPRNDAFQVASKMVDLIKLNFDVPVPWDINSLAKDYANWITHSGSTTLTSKTGILCTKTFNVWLLELSGMSSAWNSAFCSGLVRLYMCCKHSAGTARNFPSKIYRKQGTTWGPRSFLNWKRFVVLKLYGI
jgi:hypothetical protein